MSNSATQPVPFLPGGQTGPAARRAAIRVSGRRAAPVAALAAALAMALLPAPEARAQALQTEEIELEAIPVGAIPVEEMVPGGLFPIETTSGAEFTEGGFTFPLGTYALGDAPLDLRLFTAGAYGPVDPHGWPRDADSEDVMLRGGIALDGAFADPQFRLTPRLSFLYDRSGGAGLAAAGGTETVLLEPEDALGSDRYGAELGLYADIPIGGDLSFFVDGAARLESDLPGASLRSLPEGQAEGGWHLGGTVGGGFALDWGQLRGSIGAEFESRQAPESGDEGDDPATLGFESRDSWVLKAQVKLRF